MCVYDLSIISTITLRFIASCLVGKHIQSTVYNENLFLKIADTVHMKTHYQRRFTVEHTLTHKTTESRSNSIL